MEFNWRLEEKANCYETLVDWWNRHEAFNKKLIEYKRIPNRVFFVSKGGVDLFSVTVYISDSTICWIGWITSNPDAKLRDKHGALEYLYEIITVVMKSQGFDCIISKTNDRSLIRALERSDFTITETSNFYVKNI